MRRWAFITAVLCTLPLVAGCNRALRTEVMLEIDAECGVRSAANEIVVVILGPDAATMHSFPVSGDMGWPRRIGLIPANDDPSRRFRVRVTAMRGATTVATTFVESGYVDQQTLGLRVVLDDACMGVTTCTDQACVAGVCEPPMRGMLPTYVPGGPACSGPLVDAGPIPDGAPPGDAGSLIAASFCSELVTMFCEARGRCCSTAMGEDPTTCRNANMGRCEATIGAVAVDPRTGYDAVLAREVLEEGRAIASTCDVDIVDWMATREGVVRALRGSVGLRGDCSMSALDVAGRYSCVMQRACRRVGVIGDRACTEVAAVTETCRESTDCETGLYCRDGRPTTDTGTCQPQLGIGMACMTPAECESLICPGDAGGTCAARTQDVVYCSDPFSAF